MQHNCHAAIQHPCKTAELPASSRTDHSGHAAGLHGVFVLGWSLDLSSGADGDAVHVHLLGTLMRGVRQDTQQRFPMGCTPLPVEPGLTTSGPRLTTPGNKTFNPGVYM